VTGQQDARTTDLTPTARAACAELSAVRPDERAHPIQVLGLGRVIRVSGRRDERIAAVAELQRGVVTRYQLRALGVTDDVIDGMVSGGRLRRLHRAVYAVGHTALPELGAETAAVLTCGNGALLSHASAAALWKLRPHDPGAKVDVIVAGRKVVRPAIRTHRTRHLAPQDVRIRHRLPVTSPARTLLDIAEIVTERELERALDEALTTRIVRRSQIAEVLGRAHGRKGAPILRALIDRAHGPTVTRSEAEERFLALVRRAGLPTPDVNARIQGYEVDFLWRAHRVVVEVDGYRYHSSRSAFERDSAKGATLAAAGLTLLRVTWRQMENASHAVVARVAGALARAAA
jgi:very-short-patch-repair endonuclease